MSISFDGIDYHSHPSGSKQIVLPNGHKATASWNQPPSRQDISTATKQGYIFGMGNRKVYI
jgi:hypothetical protein